MNSNWITDSEFEKLEPRNVFSRQLTREKLPCDEHRNCHILFRKKFTLSSMPQKAVMRITADDYYKLYINGKFVSQGPAPTYHFSYGYNTLDVTGFLQSGENTIAIHTLYQGLINRVWVSGDLRHGMVCELEADGEVIVKSDESFLTHRHTGYRETGTVGYATQFLEEYDSSSAEVGFEQPDFDDSYWENAVVKKNTDYTLVEQTTKSLVFETIKPIHTELHDDAIFIDFGACYVGYLNVTAKGNRGESITVRCGQELNGDDTVRYNMRCNCKYEETWLLSGKTDTLDWFDYKSFRYVELLLPDNCEIRDISLTARHYPFALKANMNPKFTNNENLKRIWELCLHSQRYGVQEVIQDCMDREKGFYLGDGCYTALTHMILTEDDSIVRKLIDDAFKTTFITPTMMTCLDCAFMQEIAEYPLYLVSLILWHYRLTGDKAYLEENYPKVCELLDAYRNEYEQEFLLQNLDKWCVVEWPKEYRDGYDVDITEGQICTEPHVVLNAVYIEAIRCTNVMAKCLDKQPYREETPLIQAFWNAFHDDHKHLFKDSKRSEHISYIGNVYTYAYMLYKDEEDKSNMESMIANRGIHDVALFGSFPLLCGLIRHRQYTLLKDMFEDEGAWLRMLREDATTTFESWGKDLKKNASLFHLTFSYAAVFLADMDLQFLLNE